ncbi:MAG: acylphosphatase [Myxococcota bacterium]
MERLHLVVTGRVQGVSFRAHTQAEARRLGVCGWVRNLPDGGVEVVAEGPRDRLEALLTWARVGPSMARVAAVEARWGEAAGSYDQFVIQRG